jgi:hypothetical protein
MRGFAQLVTGQKRISMNTKRQSLFAFAILLVLATGLVTIAQTPAGAPQAPAAQAPPQGAGQATPDAPPGRGGGRGRGGPDFLAGGPQLDDPAYANVDFSKKPPVPALTPDQELAKFVLQPGYHLELVLSDPIIQEPTAIAFDGNGRMFVLEDRGYMQDADATGEHDPIGRVSLTSTPTATASTTSTPSSSTTSCSRASCCRSAPTRS